MDFKEQTIYTVKSGATEFEERKAVFLPKHTSRESYSTRTDEPHWLVLGECNKTEIIPQQPKLASWAIVYVFTSMEDAAAQVVKELEKKKESIRKQIEEKQKELEALQ